MQRKKGFTLIELLVVISIIAILSAILFPVFARARENARRASCMSNMKQLGLAFMQYSQDYDEQLPINCYSNAANGEFTTSWDVGIAPYSGVKVKGGSSPAIFRCPSDTSADNKRSYAMTYGSNYILVWNDAGTMVGVKLAAIPQPAQTILLAEFPSSPVGLKSTEPTYVNNGFGNYSNSYVTGPSGPVGTVNVQDKSRPGKPIHLDGWNYLFSDGHVKWTRPEQTLAPVNLWRRVK